MCLLSYFICDHYNFLIAWTYCSEILLDYSSIRTICAITWPKIKIYLLGIKLMMENLKYSMPMDFNLISISSLPLKKPWPYPKKKSSFIRKFHQTMLLRWWKGLLILHLNNPIIFEAQPKLSIKHAPIAASNILKTIMQLSWKAYSELKSKIFKKFPWKQAK